MKKRHLVVMFIVQIIVISMLTTTIFAASPDRAYTYNSDKKPVPSPNSFQVKDIIYGKDLPCGTINNAQDFFLGDNGDLYIADSANARVVILDNTYKFKKELKTFNNNGESLTLAAGFEGVFYHEEFKLLYIADTANNRIVVSDLEGNVETIYEKPVSVLLKDGVPYAPKKIIVDNSGIMYVLSKNVNTGAMMLDSSNKFLGFYGTNEIKETLTIKIERFWRSIMTEEQRNQSEYSFQPMEFNNLFLGKDRFIYAVSQQNEFLKTEVAKLNAKGQNILEEKTYGEMTREGEMVVSFADITVDDEGFITVLDRNNGKLYQYDENSNLLAIFGGLGTQKGMFVSPIAIETDKDGNILVLDAIKNCVVIMEPTYYGEMIRSATIQFNEGVYDQALEPWENVLRMNSNFELAYIGIGKAKMMMGEYDEAMSYFKKGGDQENYSLAKTERRNEFVNNNFIVFITIIILALILIMFYEKIINVFKSTSHRVRKRKKSNGGVS